MTSPTEPNGINTQPALFQALSALSERIEQITDATSSPEDVAERIFREGADFFPNRAEGPSPFESWIEHVAPELSKLNRGNTFTREGRYYFVFETDRRVDEPLYQPLVLPPLLAVLEDAYDESRGMDYAPYLVVTNEEEDTDWRILNASQHRELEAGAA